MKVKNFMKKLSALALGLGMTLGVVSAVDSNSAHEVDADSTVQIGPDFNALFGTNYSGIISSVAANSISWSGTTDGVTLSVTNGSSKNGYVKTSDFRAYNGYTLTFSALNPIVSITSTKGGKAFSSGVSAATGSLSIDDNTISWTGSETSVVLSCSATVSFASFTVTLSGGTTPTPGHEHTPSTSWTSDETGHWHVCTDADCPTPDTKIEKANHEFGEWTVTREATEALAGEKVRTCTVCGYENKASYEYTKPEAELDGTYKVLKDASQLHDRDHIIIGNGTSGDVYFVSEEQNDNNRKGVTKSVSNEKINVTRGTNDAYSPMQFTVEIEEGKIRLRANNYGTSRSNNLYLTSNSSTSKNYCNVKAYAAGYGDWTISIESDGKASIIAGSGSRNVFCFNGVTISCYASLESYKSPVIYKQEAKVPSVESVTLNKTTAEVAVGNTVELTATVEALFGAAETVTWSSSQPSVATVVDGVVTAVTAGTTVITATSTFDTSKSASCTVSVIENNVAVTGLSLDQTSLALDIGATGQLTATVSPTDATNKTVAWDSSVKTVATVDSTGLVTAVGVGETVISATTEDGGFEKTCTVTVVDSNALNGKYTNKFELRNNFELFESIGSSYAEKTISNTDGLTAVFSGVSKQGSTITDMPVMKGGNLTISAPAHYAFTAFEGKFKQWNTKAISITVEDQKGTNLFGEDETIDNFYFDLPVIEDVVTSIKLSIGGEHIGIVGFSYELVELEVPALENVTNLAYGNGKVTWDAVTGASGYSVKLDKESAEIIQANEFDVSSLTQGSSHTIEVTAVGDGENYVNSGAETLNFEVPLLDLEEGMYTIELKSTDFGGSYLAEEATMVLEIEEDVFASFSYFRVTKSSSKIQVANNGYIKLNFNAASVKVANVAFAGDDVANIAYDAENNQIISENGKNAAYANTITITFIVGSYDEYVWLNGDVELQRSVVCAGEEAPVFAGVNPEKAADENYVYVFAGWDEEVKENVVTFAAQFDSIKKEAFNPIAEQTLEPVLDEDNQPIANTFKVETLAENGVTKDNAVIEGITSEGKVAQGGEVVVKLDENKVFTAAELYLLSGADSSVMYSRDLGATWHTAAELATKAKRATTPAIPSGVNAVKFTVTDADTVKGLNLQSAPAAMSAEASLYMTWNWTESDGQFESVDVTKTAIKFTFSFNSDRLNEYISSSDYTVKFMYKYADEIMEFNDLVANGNSKVITSMQSNDEISLSISLSTADKWDRLYSVTMVVVDNEGNIVDHAGVISATFNDVFCDYYDNPQAKGLYEAEALDAVLDMML